MSPKNAIKIINIQKIYLVHIGSIQSIMYASVQFGPIRSMRPLSVHSVLFSPFCPIKFYSVHSVFFNPLQSYSAHSIHIGLILSISVLFGLNWSYSVHYVQFCPIRSVLSTLVLFGSFCPL